MSVLSRSCPQILPGDTGSNRSLSMSHFAPIYSPAALQSKFSYRNPRRAHDTQDINPTYSFISNCQIRWVTTLLCFLIPWRQFLAMGLPHSTALACTPLSVWTRVYHRSVSDVESVITIRQLLHTIFNIFSVFISRWEILSYLHRTSLSVRLTVQSFRSLGK
jgi:hypothetical protein